MIRLLVVALAILAASCSSASKLYPKNCPQLPSGWPSSGVRAEHSAIWNFVDLAKTNSLSWNSQPVEPERLAEYLRSLSGKGEGVRVNLTIEAGTDCSKVEELRLLMNKAPICAQEKACREGPRPRDLIINGSATPPA